MPAARTNFNNYYEVTPQYIPSSSAAVVAADAWIEELHLVNNTGTSQTVTITDGQGTPVPLLKDISIDPGVEFHRRYGSLYMPGGINWVCSAADAIAARLRYKS